MVRLIIDGAEVDVPAGASVLDACDLAGAYVPRLCAYPGLEPRGDCGLCFVRLGAEGFPPAARRACSVTVSPAMVVDTRDPEAQGFRLSSMRAILADHPHVCLTCPLRDGCSRDECTYGNEPEARCCREFGRCEIAEVAAFVGALETAPSYRFRALGVAAHLNIRRDLDLCIGCGRCVAACDVLQEAGSALRLVETRTLVGSMRGGIAPNETGRPAGAGDILPAGADSGGVDGVAAEWEPRSYLGRHVAVPVAADGDLRASGCTSCGACVMVCPSGALTADGAKGSAWLARRRELTALRAAVRPPHVLSVLSAEEVGRTPPRAGVFRLFSGAGDLVQISGVRDLKAALTEVLAGPLAADVAAFAFEEEPMYTQRESELLAHYVQAHGTLPRGSDVPGELYGDDDGERP